MQYRHLRPRLAGCAHEREGMLMVPKSHEWSSLSWRNLLWQGDSCRFVGAATYGLLTRLRLRPTRCISWRGWCKWTPVEPAGTCPGYRSSKLGGSEDPWTTGARDEHTAIGGGSLA